MPEADRPDEPSGDDKQQTARRDFLIGRSLRSEVLHGAAKVGDALRDGADSERSTPEGGETLRLATRAMACEFSVVLNPGEHGRVWIASDALELVHELEQQMTVYREDSELSDINRRAATETVEVDERLFELLTTCRDLANLTSDAFDPTSGPLIALWRQCRDEGRIPTQHEIDQRLERTGMQHVELDESDRTIRFDCEDVELNLGGIGKGYALDRAAEYLSRNQIESFLLHGGRSSVLARGDHNEQGGWPVGIGNPLFTDKRLGTLLLRDQALSTSGSNIQYFRHQGRRYGHILDPRTGRPMDGTLSVTVVAPSAAVADALSTAFFVLGVEKARECCDNLDHVGAILIPQPERGRRVRPVVIGISEDQLFWDSEQVEPESTRPESDK